MGLLLLLWLLVALVRGGEDSFSEELTVRPLRDGRLLAQMELTVRSSVWDAEYFELFPRSLGRLVDRYSVESFRVTLGAGRWFAEKWGFATRAAPEGLMVEATLAALPEGGEGETSRWEGFCEALGAMLGASMGFLKDAHSIRRGNRTWMGWLPGETVCTENLTPWIHMLPCRDRSGFGRLLNPLKIFASTHHSLGMVFQRVAEEAHVTFSLNMVTAEVAHSGPWTVQSLFDTTHPLVKCELSHRSTVVVDQSIRPDCSGTLPGAHEIGLLPFDLKLLVPAQQSNGAWRTPLEVTRFLTGVGLDDGGMRMMATSGNEEVVFSYLDIVPWQFHVVPSSLELRINGQLQTFPSESFVPAIERQSPSVLEFTSLRLAKNSTLTLDYKFVKAFLHLSEYPPDAHFGFIFPGARVSLDAGTFYTDVQVSQTALPDFSMPFNVVTLSGILLGFFFGAILGLVTTRLSVLKTGQAIQSEKPVAKLLRRILALIDGE